MDIRPATVDDIETVARLVNSLIEELGGESLEGEASLDACRMFLSQIDGGMALIAEDNGEPIGVCTMTFQLAVRTLGKYATVQEMYVSPDHRSNAVGERIIDRAVAEAQMRGCGVIELGTPPDGSRQERFYERLGFKPVGLRLRKTIV